MSHRTRPVAIVLDRALWAAQIFLALVLGWVGATRLGAVPDPAGLGLPWPPVLPDELQPVVGLLSLLAALLVALPPSRDGSHLLVGLAAAASAAGAALGSLLLLLAGSGSAAASLAYLALLAAFVAWGRTGSRTGLRPSRQAAAG